MRKLKHIIHIQSEIKVPRKHLKLIKVMCVTSMIFIVLLCIICTYLETRGVVNNIWQYVVTVLMVVCAIFLSASYKTEKTNAEIRIYDEYLEIYEPKKYSQIDGFYECLSRFSYNGLEIDYESFFGVLIFSGECVVKTKTYGEDSAMTNVLSETEEKDTLFSLDVSSEQLDDIVCKLKEFASVDVNTDW